MAVLTAHEVGAINLERHLQVPFTPYFFDSASYQSVTLCKDHRQKSLRIIVLGILLELNRREEHQFKLRG